MTEILFIAGDQLFDAAHLGKPRDRIVLMVESAALCTRLPFHQQKLGFVLSAMRAHADALRRAGFDVRYHDLEEGLTVAGAVRRLRDEVDARHLAYFDTEDRGLLSTLHETASSLNLHPRVIDSPMFLLTGQTVDNYFCSTKNPRMAGFYRTQRQRLNILVAGGHPLGGRWSFDTQNRSRLPRHQAVPELPPVRHDRTTRDCLALVASRFADHPGRAEDLWIPCDRAGALAWLDDFLEHRLTGFGTYEDAITRRSRVVFHSVLSPFLNVGLLTPEEVVTRALDAAESAGTPLNDLEGFIRQIIGWREFIRGAYRHHRDTMRRRNVWNGNRQPARSWLSGETGLLPLDIATRNAIDLGWNHHIERLMVIANLMNLAGIHPQAAHRYFMTHYLDAYDWVMVPNVYGMGLTSDGGIFATKPYICGSNYILKMSDYSRGPWTDVMDGLYWRFVVLNRRVLATNPRLAMMVRALDRLDPSRLSSIIAKAEQFIDQHTQPCTP